MRFALLIFRYFPYGGLQRDCVTIAGILAKRDHEVEILTASWNGPVDRGLRVALVQTSGSSNHARALSFARNAASKLQGYDAVIGFNRMPGLDIYYAADQCFMARNENRLAGLFSLTPRYRAYIALERAVFAPTQKTHALLLSGAQRTDFMRCYGTPENRLHIVPPGIAKTLQRPGDATERRLKMRQMLGIARNEHCALLVAADFKTKGLARAIRAIASLPARLQSNTRLVAVGSDDKASYERLATRLGIASRISILPAQDDIASFYLAADLLLHPSRLDTTGTVILEAVVSGLPVLCTGVCGYAEHVRHAEAGMVLAEPFAQSALNIALERALDSGLLSTWSENAIVYGRTADLYRGREVAADLIESLTLEKLKCGKSRGPARSAL
jgi:UDP-glucose:(heptosyl)LPS alpha-1,3-glucosyltransferase